MIDYLLEYIYPPRCIFCNQMIEFNKPRIICQQCLKMIIPMNNKSEAEFKKDISVFLYNEIVSHAIYKFKYGKHDEMSVDFAKLMFRCLRETWDFENNKIDILIPVPMYKKKERKRGFNQATLLANQLSLLSKIETDATILKRIKNTQPQSGLTGPERHENLIDAFSVKENKKIVDKNIMLIDDIYTTGSTIMACSDVLLVNGAHHIFSFTLARTDYQNK